MSIFPFVRPSEPLEVSSNKGGSSSSDGVIKAEVHLGATSVA